MIDYRSVASLKTYTHDCVIIWYPVEARTGHVHSLARRFTRMMIKSMVGTPLTANKQRSYIILNYTHPQTGPGTTELRCWSSIAESNDALSSGFACVCTCILTRASIVLLERTTAWWTFLQTLRILITASAVVVPA